MTKERVDPGAPGLQVRVSVLGPNGKENLPAALDTAATYCLLPSKTLKKLGYDLLDPLDRTKVEGLAPYHEMPLYLVDRFTTLRLSKCDCIVGAFDLPKQTPVKALVGLSFLRHFRFTLDLPGGFLALRYSPYYNRRR